jgi:hypothetical protein
LRPGHPSWFRFKKQFLHTFLSPVSNPVTRGLVQHPKEWPWSSFLFYAKDEAGLVAIDPVD